MKITDCEKNWCFERRVNTPLWPSGTSTRPPHRGQAPSAVLDLSWIRVEQLWQK